MTARGAELRRRAAMEDGAVAVEFALLAPLLLALVFGIICFGYFFLVANSMQQLAAEAARVSVSGITTAEREMLALEVLQSAPARFAFLDGGAITPSVAVSESPVPSILVEVSYDLTGSVVGVFDGFLGFDVSSISTSSYVIY